jgi:hypothetical protein
MKLELSNDLVRQMSLTKVPKLGIAFDKWQPTDKPNYLVYDTSRKAPPGFAVRVGARASVYIVEKMVRQKKLKITQPDSSSPHSEGQRPWVKAGKKRSHPHRHEALEHSLALPRRQPPAFPLGKSTPPSFATGSHLAAPISPLGRVWLHESPLKATSMRCRLYRATSDSAKSPPN